ncbi:MAG: hypothetical protein KGJ79_07265 [Alphaproteobacteria bacterium]|nr:hypothetical protein [Alphaproteobacteria bacterium]MDE2110924.1 hypothetical protein [Alphaproteobacteria bacterium]MDE2495407.1 hypothetical protein [Alphaproteobacteria bacterium]
MIIETNITSPPAATRRHLVVGLALWALFSVYVVKRLRGLIATRAVMLVVMFCVSVTAQLLYPNPFMPWVVRRMRLIKVGASEAVYGVVAAVL